MILARRPHSMSYIVSEPTQTLPNGDKRAGARRVVGSLPCHAVPLSGEARLVRFADGTERRCSWVIHVGLECRDLKLGDRIQLSTLEQTAVELEVVQFVRYQTRVKIWV